MTVDPDRNLFRFAAMDPALCAAYYLPVRDLTAADAARRAYVAEALAAEREAGLDRRVAEMQAEREAEKARLRHRHAHLIATHSDHPVLAALLDEHAPHEGRWDPECHGCPANVDYEQGEEPASWPCPPWTTISERTEEGTVTEVGATLRLPAEPPFGSRVQVEGGTFGGLEFERVTADSWSCHCDRRILIKSWSDLLRSARSAGVTVLRLGPET